MSAGSLRPLLLAAAGAACLPLCAPTPARAQSVEYGAFEQLFGEPVTVSVTGKPQRVSEVPAEMDILTAEDIRRSGATSIPEALRFLPGVDVRQYGQGDYAVGIRGNDTALNPRVLVLLDGRQVYEDDYGFTSWPLIPVALGDIRQIEVIKGPNAALYGFNAVSGVINIVTFDPLHDAVNVLRADGGTQSTARGEATTTFQVPGRLGVRVSAVGLHEDQFAGREGLSNGQGTHAGSLALDARAQVLRGVEWDLSGSVGSTEQEQFADYGLFVPVSLRANSVRSRLAAETGLGLLQLDAYRNENGLSETNPFNTDRWREDVTVVQLSDLVKLGADHTIRLAGEYRDNAVSSLSSFNGRLGYTIASASAMWNWQVTPAVSLVNAVRVDDLHLTHQGMQAQIPGITDAFYHDATLVEPSFNSGLVWHADERDTVRLSAARASQLPSLVDFGLFKDVGYALVAGNPGLAPSEVMNYELDWDRSLPLIASTLRLALFHQDTSQVIGSPFGSGYTFLPTGQVLEIAQNFPDSHENGGELGLKGAAGPWHWNASYALALVHDTAPRALLETASSISLQRQTPTHVVVLGLGWSGGPWELDGDARWQSHFEDYRINPDAVTSHQVVVPNYVTATARVAYRVNEHVTVALTAQQLNQHRLIESAGLQTERQVLFSVTGRF